MSKKKKSKGLHDPYAEREASRYENPIPSREFILEVLVNHGEPLKRAVLAKHFHLKSEDQLEALRRRLIAMVRDCQIAKTPQGYAALTLFKETQGVMKIKKDGFGVIASDDGDVMIPPRDARGFYDGDELKVRITGYTPQGKAQGKIVEVVHHAKVTLIGRFFKEHDSCFVMPLGKTYATDIWIPKNLMQAQEGDIVQVQLDRNLSSRKEAVGKVIHILGDPEREGIEIDIALLKFQVPNLWPRGIIKQAKAFGSKIPEAEVSQREDLRELPFVTIDGEDAKDFDDAVYCERRPRGGFRLFVAIADVSHYVKPGTMLDEEGENRGNSVYFPGFVVPMLPETLSNGLCSLKPKQDRLALVCEMLVNKEGQVTRSKFYNATICSHARLIYGQVAKVLAGDKRQRNKLGPLVDDLEALLDLFNVLLKARQERGAIEFETVETQIMFDELGKIAAIQPSERNVAHRIIEECMLAANVSAAKFLTKHKCPTLYREHAPPPEEKLTGLRDFLKELGLSLGGRDKPTPREFTDLLEKIADRPDAKVIQTVMLRSMSQAMYTTSQEGHFGLAYPAYVHFTSPIRRYPDLIVHRQIKQILAGKSIDKERMKERLDVLGEHCSMTERRADDATRDATMALKCHYMSDKIGQSFEGTITAVTSFGLFVELNQYYVDGLVHVASLGDDYFYFEPFKHRMIGERTRKVYQLGDSLEVTLMQVDLEDKKLDLAITATLDEHKPTPKRGKSKPKDKGRPSARGKGKGKGKGKAKTRSGKPKRRKR